MKESSDKNKPQKLEDLFRQSLEEAEVTPSDRVWERIAQGLDSKEAGYYKERVGWYRSLAAACIFFVACAAGYLFYDLNYSHWNKNTIAQQPATPATTPATGNPNASAPFETTGPTLAQTESVRPGNGNLPAATERPRANEVTKAGKAVVSNHTRRALPSAIVVPEVALTDASTPEKAGKNNNVALTQKDISGTGGATEEEEAGAVTGITPMPEALKSVAPGLLPGISQAAVLAEMRLLPETTKAVPGPLALLPEPAPDRTEKGRAGRWNLNFRFAPQYFNQNIKLAQQNYRGLAANAPAIAQFSAPGASNVASSSYTQALEEFDNNTTAGFSYNTAVAAGYTFNEHWSLESGLTFTQNVANSRSSFIFNNTNLAARYNSMLQSFNSADIKQNNDPLGILPATALPASLSGQQNINTATVVQTPAFDTQYRYRLIGIPVRIKYQTSQRKSFYFASAGFLTNMLVQAHVLSGSAKVPDLKYQGQANSPFRTWQVAATVSAGRGFQISRAVNFRAGLEGTQNLNSLAAHPEYLSNGKGKPYTLGVAFSTSYTLGL